MTKYPTEWAHGLPRGYITPRGPSLMLMIKSTTGEKKKKFNATYPISDFSSVEECRTFVENMQVQKSHELGLTRNEIRFINKNTIEVQLTQDKTFITDAKHLEIVNKYPLQAKAKKETNITRFYVVGQDKKKTFQFTDLITNYKIVEYINGDPLDLREINMKEFGLEQIVAVSDDNLDGKNIIEDHSKYYFMPIDELPHNKWILGNVPGTIFFRKEEKNKILTMRLIDDNDKMRNKSFTISNYESVKHAKLEARKYMINVAHSMGLVKNRIRILDNKLIEVMLDEEYIMTTDDVYLPLFIPSPETLSLNLTVSKSGLESSGKMYAAIYNMTTKKLMTFHKFIMGSPWIDHINGNGMDNRLDNLRFTTPAHNSTNKIDVDGNVNGVIFRRGRNENYYEANINGGSQYFYKKFSPNSYPNPKESAIKFRKKS